MTNTQKRKPSRSTQAAQIVFQSADFILLIASYQDGLPEDLNARMKERYTTILLAFNEDMHRWPPSFRQLHNFPDRTLDLGFKGRGLHIPYHLRDTRFPLHLAIAEGEFYIVKRFYEFKPQLFTALALRCAFNFEQYEIALWLCSILRQRNPDIVNDEELKQGFEFDRNYEDDRKKVVEWYLCLDTLGFPVPFKQGNILERKQVEEFLGSELAFSSAVKALNENNLDSFIMSLQNPKFTSFEQIIGSAAEQGKIEFIAATIEHAPRGLGLEIETFQLAAEAGHADVLEWMHQKYGIVGSLDSWELVVENGHLEVLRWLHQHHKYNWTKRKFSKPRKVNDVDIVKFLHEIKHPLNQIWPLSEVVASFLVDNKVKITNAHLTWAVGGNRDEVGNPRKNLPPYRLNLAEICRVYWERCPNMKFTSKQIDLGIELGELKFVQLLYESKVEGLTELHLKQAIKYGHYEVVKFMHEVVGWSIPDHALDLIIFQDELLRDLDYKESPLLQYLVHLDKERKWTICSYTCNYVTFETIQWLIAECKYSKTWKLVSSCVRFGSVEVLSFIASRTTISISDLEKALFSAIMIGAMNLLEYLWELLVQEMVKMGRHFPKTCDIWLREVEMAKHTPFLGSWETFTNCIQATQAEFSKKRENQS